MHSNDTIAAIATGAPGAVGIVRLSGPAAVEAAGRVFTPLDGRPLAAHAPGALVYGTLRDAQGQAIDRVLATYSRAPRSYTGQDTAELHCHGSPVALTLALEALFAHGCRQAGAGEFTRRAFLNGKLDLNQAEAVVDLIDAPGREAVRHAAGRLGGALSRRVEEIYRALVDVSAHFCAALDYPDEDIDPFTAETLAQALSAQRARLEELLRTWERGRHVAQGIPCALVGRPNVGKSSLLNALLGYERAIVTAIPGTTRDTVEERVELGGAALRLIDTAGLRASDDPVEQLGVARSRRAMEGAALILVLADSSAPFTPEDEALLREAQELAATVLVWTKCDLPRAAWRDADDARAAGCTEVAVSAHTGAGLDELAAAVAALFPKGSGEEYGAMLTNLRQAEGATRALESVCAAHEALIQGMTPDAVLGDVEQAMAALGELTGRTVRDDVTDRIFERFCVGK